MKNLIFVICLFAGTIHAQGVLFTLEDATFEPGQQVQMPCKAYGFSQIASFQFGVLFDTAALKLDSVKVSGVLPDYNTELNFSWKEISQATTIKPGSLYTLWTDPFGKTLEDGNTLFTVYFTAKASGSLSQNIVNYPEGMPFEAIRYPFEFIPIDVVFVAEISAANEPASEALTVAPNPFAESFTINQGGILSLYDPSGRLVYRSEYVADTPIGGELKAGIYYATIGNRSFRIAKQ